MEITEFARKVIHWQQPEMITSRSYPATLELYSPVWDQVRELRKYTDGGASKMRAQFPNYSGSLGYEHSATLAYIVDKLYVSSLLSGSWTSVTTQMHIQVKHDVEDEQHVIQQRLLNRRLVEKRKYSYSELNRLGKLEFGFLLNMHTHPQHSIGHQKIGYGFYSSTDIRSLLSSGLYISGLVTDRLWLLCKTSLSKMPEADALARISLAEHLGIDKMVQQSKLDLVPNGFVIYTARFGETLIRID